MNALLQQRLARSMAIGLLLIAPLGCTVTGGGLAYDGTVGVGLDYYEPSGFDYGGWGPGYVPARAVLAFDSLDPVACAPGWGSIWRRGASMTAGVHKASHTEPIDIGRG